MWLPRAEYQRLVEQAARCQFVEQACQLAEARTEEAEKQLAAERAAKDWMVTQLTSRFVTKQGGYGLDHAPQPVMPTAHPKGYTHEPSEMDMAKLEYYKDCARAAGVDEGDAIEKWEAEMRGESLVIEAEAEN